MLATPGIGLFELATVTEVFGVDRPELDAPWYGFALCTADPGPIATSSPLPVIAPGDLEEFRAARRDHRHRGRGESMTDRPPLEGLDGLFDAVCHTGPAPRPDDREALRAVYALLADGSP